MEALTSVMVSKRELEAVGKSGSKGSSYLSVLQGEIKSNSCCNSVPRTEQMRLRKIMVDVGNWKTAGMDMEIERYNEFLLHIFLS